MDKRLIFHVDVNSAFLSWEAVRRVQEGKEDLRLIPSCIGGDPAKRTSVVLAKSIPAKKYGITTGEPMAMALRKCPGLYVAGADFRLYDKQSRAFKEICRRYAPAVEEYSIDECFLDMSGTRLIYPDPIATAYEIKDEIRDTLGFTVNVGISTNKLLAKMAGDFEKPDKVHTLFLHELEEKLWQLPVQALLTVGESTAEKLKRVHIFTIGDLAKSDVRLVQKAVGQKNGQQIHNYANGIDDSPVHGSPEEAKGYSVMTTLEDDVVTLAQANGVLLSLADSVASRIRADHAKAFCVSVTIRGNDFKKKSHQRNLSEATDITTEIYEIAKELFAELWDGAMAIRLIGIALANISRDGCEQFSLFKDERKEKERRLDETVDYIRKKFGADTIVRGRVYGSALDVGKKYKAQAENRKDGEEGTYGTVI